MPSPLPPAPQRSPRELLLGTRAGRVFLTAAAVKLLLAAAERLTGLPPVLAFISTLAGILLVVTAVVFIVRALHLARRQLLWPVRRKLIVSYLFIGLVPALLLLVFFLFGGQIVFSSVAAYLFKSGFERYQIGVDQIAQATANDVARATPAQTEEIVAGKFLNLNTEFPGLALAVVPLDPASPFPAKRTGSWRHLAPPERLPAWLQNGGFTGIVSCRTDEGVDRLIARSVKFPENDRDHLFVVVADLPLGQLLADQLRETTEIRAVAVESGAAYLGGPAPVAAEPCLPGSTDGPSGEPAARMPFRYDRSIAFLDYRYWESGATGRAAVSLRVRLSELYREVTEAQAINVPGANMTLGQAMFLVVVIIGVLFLIIEAAALVMGLALARSITTAVHGLFVGTERVRQGDFTHRIDVQARDQLGQLADSFNQMSTSIEHLLQQAAEKRRLEEELRIAREIQMSLLPSGSPDIPGVSVTALCVPAREVGGDYYDFFRLSERRFSLLIADVSGKGTSAALYMAELKGLLLSLSSIYQSPRQLLIEVNRILSDHLDTRSFITMTYAVIDLDARTLVFARAGHTPFMYLPASGEAGRPRAAQVLVPDGMVLGLRVPNIERLFPAHLTEHTIAFNTGDVMALYTDGITEAMNAAGDLFGEARLAHLIEEHAHLDIAELRERIVREVEAFAGAEDQHDDVTMILMRIDEPGARLPAVHTEGVLEA